METNSHYNDLHSHITSTHMTLVPTLYLSMCVCVCVCVCVCLSVLYVCVWCLCHEPLVLLDPGLSHGGLPVEAAGHLLQLLLSDQLVPQDPLPIILRMRPTVHRH